MLCTAVALCATMQLTYGQNTNGSSRKVTTTLKASDSLQTAEQVKKLESIVISGSRAGSKTPLTTTTLNRQQLEEEKLSVSVPYMLELQPSVVVTGENGASGETKISIRGVSASRINVNINGITLNDPESQEVFWYNIPNLGGMAQSIQIQRGVGSSTGGTPSFGGAMNLNTLNASSHPYANIDLGYGSWNTITKGITAGSGLTKHGFSFDMSYSGLNSDGYIRGNGADQQSLFLCGNYYGERSLLKALFIMGSQTTGITWNGAYAEDLDNDRRYNPAGKYVGDDGQIHYYKDEVDNYNQRHYQLYYTYMATDRVSFNAAFDFTHGDGYYENYRFNKKPGQYGLAFINGKAKSDFIHRKEMYNSSYTGTFSVRYKTDMSAFDLGETYIYYDGDHFGNLVWSKDSLSLNNEYLFVDKTNPYMWYNNTGIKKDNTFFARQSTDLNDHLNIYAEAQLRNIDYSIFGTESDREDIDFHEKYLFFNPKLGLNYVINDNQRLYFVSGIVSREPTRSDIKESYLEGDSMMAETMLDMELGYNIAKDRFSMNANIYAMIYHNQMTPSGNYSPTGYALMENVEKSYRLGVELTAGYRFTSWFSLDGNLTLSTNRILDYRCMVTTDDWRGKVLVDFGNTDLSLSPSVIGAAIATFRPVKNAKIQLTGKYVGSQYADNSSREEMKVDPYFLLNLRGGYTFNMRSGSQLECQLAVNNLLNLDYRLSAYASSTIDPVTGTFTYDRTYFQQPGTNFMARVIYKF